jgi:hypothetical protein
VKPYKSIRLHSDVLTHRPSSPRDLKTPHRSWEMSHDDSAISHGSCEMSHKRCEITRKSRAICHKDFAVRLFHHNIKESGKSGNSHLIFSV